MIFCMRRTNKEFFPFYSQQRPLLTLVLASISIISFLPCVVHLSAFLISVAANLFTQIIIDNMKKYKANLVSCGTNMCGKKHDNSFAMQFVLTRYI